MFVKIDKAHVSLYGEIRPPVRLQKTLDIIRDHLITQVVAACDGNRKRAAKILGIPRTTLIHNLGQAALRRRASDGWAKVIEVS